MVAAGGEVLAAQEVVAGLVSPKAEGHEDGVAVANAEAVKEALAQQEADDDMKAGELEAEEAAARKLDTSAEDAANEDAEMEKYNEDEDPWYTPPPKVKILPSKEDVDACMGNGFSNGECRTLLMGDHHF